MGISFEGFSCLTNLFLHLQDTSYLFITGPDVVKVSLRILLIFTDVCSDGLHIV